MKIAILGTRGIPNNYGGFEQFAEYLSVGLVEKGHDVTVILLASMITKEPVYKGVGNKAYIQSQVCDGQFFRKFFSLIMPVERCLEEKGKFDILYELGYTSVVPSYMVQCKG